MQEGVNAKVTVPPHKTREDGESSKAHSVGSVADRQSQIPDKAPLNYLENVFELLKRIPREDATFFFSSRCIYILANLFNQVLT